ncbi:MAG: peptidoglycan-associated lipoprotein Pal [Pseudomonadota bacterium]
MRASVGLAIVLGVGACATTPEPEPAPPVAEPEPAPAPAPPPPPPVQQPAGPVAGSVEDFRVNVGERVFFDLDSSALDSDDRATLQRQAAFLQQYQTVRIVVAGNCDERGTREYNLALGERRANAVKDYLVSLGVAASRIETISYGKERPLDPGQNEAAWAVNRNGHTQIVSGANT